jgi:hypothetical protein
MKTEEIKALISEHGLESDIAMWASGTEKGKELMNNYSKAATDNRTREIYESFDNDLKDLGIEKGGRKTYEAYKQAVLDERQKLDKIPELQNKISELKNKGADETLTAQLEAQTNKIKELEEYTERLKSEAVQKQKENFFTSAMKNLAFDEKHDPNLVDVYKEKILSDLLNATEFDNDKLVIKDGEGKIWLNNEHRPIDAQEALTAKLSNFLKADSPQGFGDKGTSKPKGEIGSANVYVDLTSVKGIEDLNTTLEKTYLNKGMDLNSSEYMNDYKYYREKIN